MFQNFCLKYASCNLDDEPPEFKKETCPKDIEVATSYRKNVAEQVTWKTPEYTDNSMLVENYQPVLAEKNGYTSPRDFEIGEHRITYTVTDRSGKSDTCSFKIIVKGRLNLFINKFYNISSAKSAM